MLVSNLTAEALDKIRACEWGRIIEKHEGPESWGPIMDHHDPEFLVIAGRPVLLPIDRTRHPNVTILRSIVSEDGNSLTVFLKDTTHYPDPEDELFWTGRMAVCDRVVGEGFFIAILYHEWFVIDNNQITGPSESVIYATG